MSLKATENMSVALCCHKTYVYSTFEVLKVFSSHMDLLGNDQLKDRDVLQ